MTPVCDNSTMLSTLKPPTGFQTLDKMFWNMFTKIYNIRQQPNLSSIPERTSVESLLPARPWAMIGHFSRLPRSKGCWDAAGVICQSPDRRDGCVQTDTNMTSDLLMKVTTSSEFTVPKKLLKIPKILPVWPQITQTGTNTECFPNIPQNKHGYQMQSALLRPADVFIKSNANKIVLQLRKSTEKHLH